MKIEYPSKVMGKGEDGSLADDDLNMETNSKAYILFMIGIRS